MIPRLNKEMRSGIKCFPDFKQRWLNVPDAVRQAFIDDLSRVCDVLKPETGLHS